MHQRWKARQRRHPQYEIDEYSGKETMREGDRLERMGERWRRRMGKMVSVVKEKEEEVQAEEEKHEEAHSRVYQGEEEKKDRPQRSSR